MKEAPALISVVTGQDINHEEEEEGNDDHLWDCGSPLYDSYELVSLIHVIDRHMMAFPSLSGSRQEICRSCRFSTSLNRLAHVIRSSSSSSAVQFSGLNSSQEESKMMMKKKKKAARGRRCSCIGVGFLSWSWRRRRISGGGGGQEGGEVK